MLKFFIPVLAIILCGIIGGFTSLFPMRLPFEVALPVGVGIALLAVLMQTILTQRLQINQLKQQQDNVPKSIPKTAAAIPTPTVTVAEIAARLQDKKAFSLKYAGIKDLKDQKILGDYAHVHFLAAPQSAPIAINQAISDPKANGQHVMMIFARMLLLLHKHDTGRGNLFLAIPVSILKHRLLGTLLQQLKKAWQAIAPRCVFVLKGKDFDQEISGLGMLHQDGARFGLDWHESLLTAETSKLYDVGVRFVLIDFSTLVALQQDKNSATAFDLLSLAMHNSNIVWIVQNLNPLTPTQPLLDQGISLVLHQES